jgi:hypothetical protein
MANIVPTAVCLEYGDPNQNVMAEVPRHDFIRFPCLWYCKCNLI